MPSLREKVTTNLPFLLANAPEVVVKVRRGRLGFAAVASTLDYISRDAQLETENDQGEVLQGTEALAELKQEWRYGGIPIPNHSDATEAVSLVLSAPAGTSPDAVRSAARIFAASHFELHQYAMVLHEPATDPWPDPPEHPHVHLLIKAMSSRGLRLAPKLADMHTWREAFARDLRGFGVPAVATRRWERFERYNEIDEGVQRELPEILEQMTAAERRTFLQYAVTAGMLMKSDETDQQIAKDLLIYMQRRLRLFTRRPKQEPKRQKEIDIER